MVSSLPRTIAVTLLSWLAVAAPASAAEALVAVAANFSAIAAELASGFESGSDHRLVLTSGSTGKLYAQIINGAPYDLFLAADRARPAKLASDGLTSDGPITYARGRLGVWIRGAVVPAGAEVPVDRLTGLRRVALANPSLAPYGSAAMDVIDHLAVRDTLTGRLAYGENVAQAFAMVASGAADGGIVAWSLIVEGGKTGQSWPVPGDWHRPIEQDAVLLRHGAENPAARAFYDFLGSAAGRGIIENSGYLLP
jgi:molybdate transport system substrate-binding protein